MTFFTVVGVTVRTVVGVVDRVPEVVGVDLGTVVVEWLCFSVVVVTGVVDVVTPLVVVGGEVTGTVVSE
ncbi:MAG: hypothetical protein WCF25_11680 [Acidimicrobiales bacterium]